MSTPTEARLTLEYREVKILFLEPFQVERVEILLHGLIREKYLRISTQNI